MALDALKSFFSQTTEDPCLSACKLWCEAAPSQALRFAPWAGGALVALIAIYCIPKIIQEGKRWHHISKNQSPLCFYEGQFFEAAKWGNLSAVKDGLQKHYLDWKYIDYPSGDNALLVALRNGHMKVFNKIKNSKLFDSNFRNAKTNEDVSDLLMKQKRSFCCC